MENQIAKAIEYAVRYGSIDGDWHKAWVIDQMVRALTNCPIIPASTTDCNGEVYHFERQGESEEYLEVTTFDDDYEWDTGIAP